MWVLLFCSLLFKKMHKLQGGQFSHEYSFGGYHRLWWHFSNGNSGRTTKENGKPVIMVSPDVHLGGLSSDALGFTDTGNKEVNINHFKT
jgi:hypothetical protein